jgi:hypothetical protein
MNWNGYPANFDQYRVVRLREENFARPKQERPWDHMLDQLSSNELGLRRELGRWEQSPWQHDYIPSGNPPKSVRHLLAHIKKLIANQLSPREQALVRLVYAEGCSSRQVAARLGLCQTRVRQISHQISTKIYTKIRQETLKTNNSSLHVPPAHSTKYIAQKRGPTGGLSTDRLRNRATFGDKAPR